MIQRRVHIINCFKDGRTHLKQLLTAMFVNEISWSIEVNSIDEFNTFLNDHL
jgi:hypothetical protein